MELNSEFDYTDDRKFQRCHVTKQNIPENQEFKLPYRYSDVPVTSIQFSNCTITKVPQGLTKIIPNLKVLIIKNSKLQKIYKNDLIEYKNLSTFSCADNQLEYLPSDLFDGFKNLESIDLSGNSLKVIGPNILDEIEKLTDVDLTRNLNYTKCYSTTSRSTATLDDIKQDLLSVYRQNSELYKQYLQRANLQLSYKMQKGMFDDLKVFFNQEENYKDFKIIIGSREFPVHKFLLAARSPTLAELLKSNPEAENLNLVDISVEIFEIILTFLYFDELPGDEGTSFLHLFAAAAKLKIKELKEFAALKIIQTIDEENTLDILKLSNKYDHDEMRSRAFEMFKVKYPKFNFQSEFAVNMDKIEKFIEIDKEITKMCIN